MTKRIILFSVLLAVLIIGLKVLEYQFLNRSVATEIYIGILVTIGLACGIWLGKTFIGSKNTDTTPLESELNPQALADYGLTKREIEILTLINEGLTNQHIADHLFVSLSTVKSHTSNIYTKLEVNNRVQALTRAKTIQ